MSERTKLPWHTGADRNPPRPGLVLSGSEWIADCEFPDDEDEGEANAAFIARACNSHEALVKALTELRNEVSGWVGAYETELRQAMGNTNVAVMQDRIANADAALAEVKS